MYMKTTLILYNFNSFLHDLKDKIFTATHTLVKVKERLCYCSRIRQLHEALLKNVYYGRVFVSCDAVWFFFS